MKKIINILKQASKDPRFYIEVLSINWGQLLLLGLIASATMALSLTSVRVGQVNGIINEMYESISYIPEFKVTHNQLKLEGKALYYQSNHFQLVIDDSISNNKNDISILVNNDKLKEIDLSKSLSLFLLKDKMIISTPNNVSSYTDNQIVSTSYYDFLNSKAELINFIKFLNAHPILIFSYIFIFALFACILRYILIMTITAFLAGIFNRRLSNRVTLNNRFKLSIICSFIPLIAMQLVGVIIPFFGFHSGLLIGLTLLTIYYAYRNHTKFIQSVVSQLNQMDLEKLYNSNDSDDKSNKHDSSNS